MICAWRAIVIANGADLVEYTAGTLMIVPIMAPEEGRMKAAIVAMLFRRVARIRT